MLYLGTVNMRINGGLYICERDHQKQANMQH